MNFKCGQVCVPAAGFDCFPLIQRLLSPPGNMISGKEYEAGRLVVQLPDTCAALFEHQEECVTLSLFQRRAGSSVQAFHAFISLLDYVCSDKTLTTAEDSFQCLIAKTTPEKFYEHTLSAAQIFGDPSILFDPVLDISGPCIEPLAMYKQVGVYLRQTLNTTVPLHVFVTSVYALMRHIWKRFPIMPRPPAIYIGVRPHGSIEESTWSVWYEPDVVFRAHFCSENGEGCDTATHEACVRFVSSMDASDAVGGDKRAWYYRGEPSSVLERIPNTPFVDNDVIDASLWQLESDDIEFWVCGGAAGRALRGTRPASDTLHSDLDLYVICKEDSATCNALQRIVISLQDKWGDVKWFRRGHVYTFVAGKARQPLQIQLVKANNVQTVLFEYDLAHVQVGWGGPKRGWTASVHAWASLLFGTGTTHMWSRGQQKCLSKVRLAKAFVQKLPIVRHTEHIESVSDMNAHSLEGEGAYTYLDKLNSTYEPELRVDEIDFTTMHGHVPWKDDTESPYPRTGQNPFGEVSSWTERLANMITETVHMHRPRHDCFYRYNWRNKIKSSIILCNIEATPLERFMDRQTIRFEGAVYETMRSVTNAAYSATNPDIVSIKEDSFPIYARGRRGDDQVEGWREDCIGRCVLMDMEIYFTGLHASNPRSTCWRLLRMRVHE